VQGRAGQDTIDITGLGESGISAIAGALDEGSMVNGSIEITSVLSKSGSLATSQLNPQWTQKILGVENYQVGSDVFTASELIASVATPGGSVSG